MMSFDVGLLGIRRGASYAPLSSLQFKAANSAILTRAPGAGDSRRRMTVSFWKKRTKLNLGSGNTAVFGAGTGASDRQVIGFGSSGSDQFRFYSALGPWDIVSNLVDRDVTAHDHWNIEIDTTLETASDRIKISRNGVRVTSFASASYPGQNTDMTFNHATPHVIGRWADSAAEYFDGTLSDFCFVDGAALGPEHFGTFNANGNWVPKRPDVTAWGTNGFWLDGEMSGTTVLDKSGNGNDWTAVNGVTTTSDVPGDKASADLGNYCRWNALAQGADAVLSHAALRVAYGTASTRGCCVGTIGVSSGKWYWAVKITATSETNSSMMTGIARTTNLSAIGLYPGATSEAWGYGFGAVYNNGGTTSYGQQHTINDEIGVALDLDARTLTFYRNGVSEGVAVSDLPDATYWPVIGDGSNTATFTAVLKNDPADFDFAAPAGFKPLCTAHLPTKAPRNPRAQIGVLTWTGDGTDGRLLSGMFTGQNAVDFAIIKRRNTAGLWQWFDSPRGATKFINSASAGAELTDADTLQAFGINAITVGANSNNNGDTYVGLFVGGLTQKTSGWGSADITPAEERYDPVLGVSIIQFTLPGSVGFYTLPHSLGQTPALGIAKDRDATANWVAAAPGVIGNGQYLVLNGTAGAAAGNHLYDFTSATITVSTSVGNPGDICILYLFADTDAVKVGTYTGNGNADGPFVGLGGYPVWFVSKRTSSTGAWFEYDPARHGYTNEMKAYLQLNTTSAEAAGANGLDMTAGGAKWRSSDPSFNANGAIYLYFAFLEHHLGGKRLPQGRAR